MARNYLDSIIGKSSYTGQRAYNVADAAIDAVIQNMNRPVPNTPAPQPTRKTPTRKKQTKPKTKKTIDVSKGGEYVVKAGDTLSSILKETTGSYKNYREIAKANGISDPNKIYAGMKIKIPGYKGVVDSKQDVTPAVSGTGQGNTSGTEGNANAGASSGSAVAKQDSLVRNPTKVLTDSISKLQTAARDTINHNGSGVARDSIVTPIDTTRSAKDSLSANTNTFQQPSAKNRLTPEQVEAINKAITEKGKTYLQDAANADITGLSGLGAAGFGGAATRFTNKILKTAYEGIVKGIKRPLSSLWRGILAPYANKAKNVAEYAQRMNNAARSSLKTKPAKIGEQAQGYVKGFARKNREVVQPTRTTIGEQAEGYVKEGFLRRSPIVENPGPYLTNRAEAPVRNMLSRMRGRVEGAIARGKGYSKAPKETPSQSYKSIKKANGGGDSSRAFDRSMERQVQGNAKPNNTKSNNNTKSRKEKLRGNESRTNARNAHRAKRNNKNSGSTITL